ncbi:hypothetical protein ACWDT6_30010, partial [Nocardia grenadensis]
MTRVSSTVGITVAWVDARPRVRRRREPVRRGESVGLDDAPPEQFDQDTGIGESPDLPTGVDCGDAVWQWFRRRTVVGGGG